MFIHVHLRMKEKQPEDFSEQEPENTNIDPKKPPILGFHRPVFEGVIHWKTMENTCAELILEQFPLKHSQNANADFMAVI